MAQAQLTAACRAHAELPPSRVLMAYLVVSNNAVAAAHNELESVVVELPADPEAYAMLADLAFQDQRRAEAELLFARSLRLAEGMKDNPKRKARLLGRAHAGLAALAEAREQWPLALDHLAAWLKAEPASAAAHQRLGKALFHQSKAKEAYQEFQAAAKTDVTAGPASAELSLADLYEQAGDQASAAKMMAAAVKRATASGHAPGRGRMGPPRRSTGGGPGAGERGAGDRRARQRRPGPGGSHRPLAGGPGAGHRVTRSGPSRGT